MEGARLRAASSSTWGSCPTRWRPLVLPKNYRPSNRSPSPASRARPRAQVGWGILCVPGCSTPGPGCLHPWRGAAYTLARPTSSPPKNRSLSYVLVPALRGSHILLRGVATRAGVSAPALGTLGRCYPRSRDRCTHATHSPAPPSPCSPLPSGPRCYTDSLLRTDTERRCAVYCTA